MTTPRRRPSLRFLLPVLAAFFAVGAAWWALRSPIPSGSTLPDAGAVTVADSPSGDTLTTRWALPPADATPGQLSGSVVVPGGGNVEGTRVTVARLLASALRGPRRLPQVHAVSVGADGAFDVGPLPPGHYAVTASGAAGATGPTVVELAAGTRGRVDLTLTQGAVALSGRVRDASGEPLSGAVVTAQSVALVSADEVVALHEVETDAAGAYAVHVPPGVYEVLVRAPEHAPDQAARVVAGPLTHDVELRLAARLGGNAWTATAGRRPEGARFQVVGGATALSAPEARADANGVASLEGLEPGLVQMLARWGDQVG
ncbi:carboxypeptidase regulatory-like domain-containing protein, partial [Pyxidicoccus sp. 3LG]